MVDISVLVTTICRESLLRAVKSVFAQSFKGSVQILIGVDVDPDDRFLSMREKIEKDRPDNFQVDWVKLPYSTSQRHGGPHHCFFGGSLRTVLSFLANSEVIVYLDDDDWFHPDHLQNVMNSIQGADWAYAYCFYANGATEESYCVDEWESVGVGRGVFSDTEGGFVRPSGLAIRKMNFLAHLHLWSMSPSPNGDSEDRLIFNALKGLSGRCTGSATVYYALDPKDDMHPYRLRFMNSKGVNCNLESKIGSVRIGREVGENDNSDRKVVETKRLRIFPLARVLAVLLILIIIGGFYLFFL